MILINYVKTLIKAAKQKPFNKSEKHCLENKVNKTWVFFTLNWKKKISKGTLHVKRWYLIKNSLLDRTLNIVYDDVWI